MLRETLKAAIYEKQELLLKVSQGNGPEDFIEVFIQPYVYGSDVLKYDFLWGYLSHNHVFYKIFADLIISAETVEIPYRVLEEVVYEVSVAEEHYAVIDGLNITQVEVDTFIEE